MDQDTFVVPIMGLLSNYAQPEVKDGLYGPAAYRPTSPVLLLQRSAIPSLFTALPDHN